MDFRPLVPGVFAVTLVEVSTDKSETHHRLEVGTPDAPLGKDLVATVDKPEVARTEGADLEAAAGAWRLTFKKHEKGSDVWDHWSVVDPTGTEVAQTTDNMGYRKGIELRGPGEPVRWRKTKFWESSHSQVEGLCVITEQQLGRDKATGAKRLVDVTVTDALAGRPDGSLLLMLALYCTYRDLTAATDPFAAGGIIDMQR